MNTINNLKKSILKFTSISKLFVIFIFIMLSTSLIFRVNCGYITESNENKILLNKPYKEIDEISFTFKLDTELNSQQYIGVRFPITMSEYIQASLEKTLSCYLILVDELDSLDKGDRLVFQPSETVEDNNIVFCRTKLTISNLSFYRLIIKFYTDSSDTSYSAYNSSTNNTSDTEHKYISRNQLSKNYYSQIGLFTSTDYRNNKLIIDSNPLFAQVVIFDSVYSTDSSTSSKPPLQVSAYTLSTSSLTYNTSFDLSLTIIINSFIDKDSIIVITWNSYYLNPPNQCTTSKIESADITDITKAGLNSDIYCIFFNNSSNKYLLKNLKENLYNERQFTLNLKGFKTKEVPTSTTQKILIQVYNKNSYSLISESALEVFKIEKAQFSAFKITQSDDYDDVYKNSIYNFKFSFSLNVDIISNVFILLQHNNYSEKTNKANFIASTCDFSENELSVSQEFGERSICVPVRNDFSYVSNIGSGIYFQMNKILKDTTYLINVFLFAEECGSISWSKAKYSDNDGNTNKANFGFIISIYNSVEVTADGSDKFSSSVLISEEHSSTSSVNCWHNEMFGLEEGKNYYSDYPYIKDEDLKEDKIIYNEITSFELSSMTDINYCKKSARNCYLNNIKDNIDIFKKAYIYTTDIDNSVKDSYFNLRADIYVKSLDSVKPRNIIASPISVGNDGDATLSGKLSFKMNSRFIQQGDSDGTCSLSWGGQYLGNNNANYAYNNLSCGSYSNPAVICPYDEDNHQINLLDFTTNESKNFITLLGSNPSIDTSSLKQDPTKNKYVLIQSVEDSGSNFIFNRDLNLECKEENNCSFYSLNLFTSCIKIAKNINSIQTQYAYLEVYLNYYSSNASNYNRINRFFKFATELRAINDFNKSYSDLPDDFITFHYVNFVNSNYNTVCLLQISSSIRDAGNLYSNILAVYLYNVNLFDVDFSNLTSDYPATPLRGYSKAYILPSAPIHSNTSFLIKNKKVFQKDLEYNSRTTPYMFLTNFVLFTNFNKYQFTDDIFIPSYCPYQTVSVSIAWMRGNNYEIESLDALIGKSSGFGGINYQLQPTFTKSLSTPKISNNVKLAFNLYSNTNDYTMYIYNIEKEAIGSFTECTGFSIFMSENIDLTYNIDYSLNFFADDNNSYYQIKAYQFTSETNFYVFGHPFNKAILAGSSVYTYKINYVNEDTITYSSNDKASYIIGITRPSLKDFSVEYSTLLEKNIVQTNNSIAFFCNGANQNNLTYLTNLNSLKSVDAFVLDFLLDDITAWEKAYISIPNKTIYPTATNYFLILFQTNISLTEESIVGFYFEGSNQNTFCYLIYKDEASFGVEDASSIINEGNYSTCYESDNKNLLYECKVPVSGEYYTVVCYNMDFDASNKESFSVSKILVYLNNTTSDVILETNPNINPGLTITLADTTNNITIYSDSDVVNLTPKISYVEYLLISQFDSYVKMRLTIDLGRPILRDTTVVISADLEDFLIEGISPYCAVTVNSSSDLNSLFLSSCKLYGNDSKFDTIEIKFKDIIVNEYLILSHNITIDIYPVISIKLPFLESLNIDYSKLISNYNPTSINNLADLNNNSHTIPYTISVKTKKTSDIIYSNTSTNDNNINNNDTSTTNTDILSLYFNFNISSTSETSDTKYFYLDSPLNQESNFCNMENILPELPNIYTDIKIMLNFYSQYYLNIKIGDKSNDFNQIIIYFPKSFVLEAGMFKCSIDLIDTEQVGCELLDSNVLSVLFSTNLNSFFGYIKLNVSGVKIEEINSKSFDSDLSSNYLYPDDINNTKSRNNNNSNNKFIKDKAISPILACLVKSYSGEIVYSGLGKVPQNLSIKSNNNKTNTMSIVKVSANSNKTRSEIDLSIIVKIETDNKLSTIPSSFTGNKMFFLLTFSGPYQDNNHTDSFYLTNYDIPTNPNYKVTNTAYSGSSNYFNFEAFNYSPDCLLYSITGKGALSTKNINSSINTQNTIELSACKFIGKNSLLFEINPTSITFSSSLKFFKIVINNIISPQEETNTIGELGLVFSSYDKSFYYQTYSNLNLLSFDNLSYPYDSFIKEFRGLAFEQNTNKWIIDVQQNIPVSTSANYIIVKPGRYTTIRAVIRNPISSKLDYTSDTDSNLNPANTTLYMDDYIFSLYETDTKLYTNIGLITVNIATKCDTIPGEYFSSIYSTNTEEFVSNVVVKIKVAKSAGKIKLNYAFPSYFKESNLININLSENTYTSFNVNFEKAYAKIKLSNKVIKQNSDITNTSISKLNENDFTYYYVIFDTINYSLESLNIQNHQLLKSVYNNYKTNGINQSFSHSLLQKLNNSIIEKTEIKEFQDTSNTFFSIDSDFPDNTQIEFIYSPQSENSCFIFDSAETKFTVKLKATTVSGVVDFSSSISLLSQGGYITPTTNIASFNLSSRSNLNRLSYKITLPVSSGYLICTLQCLAQKTLTDDAMIATAANSSPNNTNQGVFSNDSDSSNEIKLHKGIASGDYMYYATYLSNSSSINISFDIIRGQYYKIKCLILNENKTSIQSRGILESINYVNSNNKNKVAYIKAVNTDTTQCINFEFQYNPPSEYKQKIVDYCQTFFVDKQSCLICVDNLGRTSEGYNFSNNYLCSAKSVYGIQRLSSEENTSSTSDQNLYVNDDKMLFYPNASGTSEVDIRYNSTHYYSQLYTTYNYMVCVVQDKQCTSPTTSFYDNMISFINSVNSNLLIENNLKIKDLDLIGYSHIQEKAAPNISDINKNIGYFPSINLNGYFDIQLYYESSLQCYWKFQLVKESGVSNNSKTTEEDYYLESDITSDNLIQCTSTARCGSVKINKEIRNMTPDNKVNFISGYYSFFIACYNDIPYPQLISNPIKLFSMRVTNNSSSSSSRRLSNNHNIDRNTIIKEDLYFNNKVNDYYASYINKESDFALKKKTIYLDEEKSTIEFIKESDNSQCYNN